MARPAQGGLGVAGAPPSSVVRGAAILLVLVALAAPTHAASNVFLNFDASWITELNAATAAAGVTTLSTTERATLQNNIRIQLQTIYAGYSLTFTTTDPGGTRESIDYGAKTSSTSTYGSAPDDPGNRSNGQTASVFARNFASILDRADSRSTQIAELSAALSGTSAHEFGHTLGLFHRHCYGDPRITPANYANTRDIQNTHIMATGSTGLSEIQRETLRTFSLWERVLLDTTGSTRFGGSSIVAAPISNVAEPSGDAGNTLGTATPLTFKIGSTSACPIAVRDGDLDGSTADLDLYSFTITTAQLFTAEIFSSTLFSADFDPKLRLLAADGTTQLSYSDNVDFSGNTFSNTNPADPAYYDPWLLNVPLNPGTYFLEVSVSSNPSPNLPAAVGDDYHLVVAIIPEPSALSLFLVGFLFQGGAFVRRRRR